VAGTTGTNRNFHILSPYKDQREQPGSLHGEENFAALPFPQRHPLLIWRNSSGNKGYQGISDLGNINLA
jgi:hypothetical protein